MHAALYCIILFSIYDRLTFYTQSRFLLQNPTMRVGVYKVLNQDFTFLANFSERPNFKILNLCAEKPTIHRDNSAYVCE